ncbi:MAG TPA: hypothetical protein VL461_09465 [Dictyobacter sp.]|jgi:hypothetical protein|nr:hypothetical protein [Dictyobacter sp.]
MMDVFFTSSKPQNYTIWIEAEEWETGWNPDAIFTALPPEDEEE